MSILERLFARYKKVLKEVVDLRAARERWRKFASVNDIRTCVSCEGWFSSEELCDVGDEDACESCHRQMKEEHKEEELQREVRAQLLSDGLDCIGEGEEDEPYIHEEALIQGEEDESLD